MEFEKKFEKYIVDPADIRIYGYRMEICFS